jgi:SHS2 domain-containing protein
MPFEEIPHTADVSLHIWASDLASLFSDAASGMYSLLVPDVGISPIENRSISISAPDPESLLVSFLSELVYLAEREQLIFKDVWVNIIDDKSSCRLTGTMTGFALGSLTKIIKAVTYHNLRIQKSDDRWDVTIVFDV